MMITLKNPNRLRDIRVNMKKLSGATVALLRAAGAVTDDSSALNLCLTQYRDTELTTALLQTEPVLLSGDWMVELDGDLHPTPMTLQDLELFLMTYNIETNITPAENGFSSVYFKSATPFRHVIRLTKIKDSKMTVDAGNKTVSAKESYIDFYVGGLPDDTNTSALQFKVSCPEGYSESYFLVNDWDFEEGTVVTIDWGDGSPIETFTEETMGDAYHEYPPSTNAICKLSANKTLPMLWLNSDAVTEIISFGTFGITNPKFSFDELVKVPDTLPTFITDMTEMFYQCRAFNDPSVINWDVSHVTKMGGAFTRSLNFNQPIGDWNVSNVTEMWDIFSYCDSFNQPLNNWDTANVTDMGQMFRDAFTFNQDISNWNTSKVQFMASMFFSAEAFNQDLSSWCVRLIPTLPISFADGATLFAVDKYPVWGTCPVKPEVDEIPSNEMHFTTLAGSADYVGTQGDQILLSDGTIVDVTVTDDTFTFNASAGKHKVVLVETVDRSNYVSVGGEALVELHNFPALSTVTKFNFCPNSSSPNLVKVPTTLPPNITNIQYMFEGATSFNQDISGWDTSNVINMEGMFDGAESFNQALNNWDTSNVTDMSNMFNHAYAFSGNISNWNVSKVTTMKYMFCGANNFNQPINLWDTSNVKVMSYMFVEAVTFNQDIGSWNVSNVTDMVNMFYGASVFNQPLGNWDTSSVFYMDSMFQDAVTFNQDLSQWCVSKIMQEPEDFATDSPLTMEHKPVWGTCPTAA